MSIAESSTSLVEGERLSRDEFLRRWEAMPNVKRAELIGGVVYMPSPLSTSHGNMDHYIAGWLFVYSASTHGCRGTKEATWFMQRDAPQPDEALWIVPESGGKSQQAGLYRSGPPEFVAEVSLSSKQRDLGPKLQLYQATGVQEYLTVLIEEREARWHRLVSGTYQVMPPGEDGVLRSVVFPGLWLNVEMLFAEDAAGVLATLQEGLNSKEHAEFVKRLAKKKRPKGKK